MALKRKIWLWSAVFLVVVLGGALVFARPIRMRLLINKTYYYQNKGDFDAALRLARELMEQYPGRPELPQRYAEVALWRARWLADQKQPGAARQILDSALELVPTDRKILEFLLYLDRAYFFDYARARNLAQRLVEDDPDNLTALYTLADTGYNYNAPGKIPPELDHYLELASKRQLTD
ncbi:MAG: tetratricopeptide repeat protein, partial [bacterium]